MDIYNTSMYIRIMNVTSSIMRAFSAAIMVAVTIKMADATATPDNFFLSFDKDLHTFGVIHRRDKKSDRVEDDNDHIKKTTKVHSKVDVFDEAEEEIFHRVENAERFILNTAGDLLRDEVNTIFGDIKHNEDQQKITRKGESVYNNGKAAITNVNKSVLGKSFVKRDNDSSNGTLNDHIKQIDMKNGFLEMMDTYADHFYEYGL